MESKMSDYRGAKQVIVIRRDLRMRRGKEIAQGAHASMMWLSQRVTASVAESGEPASWHTGRLATWLGSRVYRRGAEGESRRAERGAIERAG
jgi:Peptidyl-tRNA hydrolase PTH2